MAKETYSKFDAAEYLKTEKDYAAFLEACLEEAGDDPAYITKALGTIARARSMSKLAKKTRLTRTSLYKSLSANGNPEFATVYKVIQALGLRLRVEIAK
jgi:probable addiction module antidote protein